MTGTFTFLDPGELVDGDLRLLLPFARRHGLRRIWIGCAPDNTASRRTCELAGGVYADTIPVPEDSDLYAQGIRQACRYYIDT